MTGLYCFHLRDFPRNSKGGRPSWGGQGGWGIQNLNTDSAEADVCSKEIATCSAIAAQQLSHLKLILLPGSELWGFSQTGSEHSGKVVSRASAQNFE